MDEPTTIEVKSDDQRRNHPEVQGGPQKKAVTLW